MFPQDFQNQPPQLKMIADPSKQQPTSTNAQGQPVYGQNFIFQGAQQIGPNIVSGNVGGESDMQYQMAQGDPSLQKQLKGLQSKFEEIKQDIVKMEPVPDQFKNHQLPLARVKKIMKSDEDVRMISAEAPVLFSKACELFITELTYRAWFHTEESKRRTLQKSDISSCLGSTDIFDFLIDIIPRDEYTKTAMLKRANKANQQTIAQQQMQMGIQGQIGVHPQQAPQNYPIQGFNQPNPYAQMIGLPQIQMGGQQQIQKQQNQQEKPN